MGSVLEEQAIRHAPSPSQRLRSSMAATRVSLSWFGVRKTLTAEQKVQAATTFAAEGDYLSAARQHQRHRLEEVPVGFLAPDDPPQRTQADRA